MIPPFVQVLREVTNEEYYQTKVMANVNYKMPDGDKLEIAHKLALQRKDKEAK